MPDRPDWMDTYDKLEKVYPGAVNAVQFCECFSEEHWWPEYIRYAEGHGVSALLTRIKAAIALCIEKGVGAQEILTKSLPEMDHPDFVKYLRAKVGAM